MEAMLIQALGFLGAAFNISKYQLREPRHIRLFTMSAALVFGIHYILLGAFETAVLCAVAVLRSATLSTNWGMHHRKIIAIMVICISLALGVYFFMVHGDWIVWLPIFGIVAHTFAEIQHGSLRMRLLMFVAPLGWFVLGLVIGSYGTVLSSGFSMCSNVLGIYRHHIRAPKKS